LIAISPIASSQIPIEIDQEWGPPKSIATEFEQVWMSHDSHLDKLPGFVAFHLLKGPGAEDHTLYASHTVWESRAVFEAWTKSEAFRAAHHRKKTTANGAKPPLLMRSSLGDPRECYEIKSWQYK
jgi:heme-degrading monooxygenase HmoA